MIRRRILRAELVQIKDGVLPMQSPVYEFESKTKESADIIVVAPLIAGGKCRELLTGVEFDSFYCCGSAKRYSKSKQITTAADLHSYYDATMEELKEYFEKHKHIEAYKSELLAIKEAGRIKGEKAIEVEKEKNQKERKLIKERQDFIRQISYR